MPGSRRALEVQVVLSAERSPATFLPAPRTTTDSKVPFAAVSFTTLSTGTPVRATLVATVAAETGGADEDGADEAAGSSAREVDVPPVVADVHPAASAATVARPTRAAARRRGRERSRPPGRSVIGSPREVKDHLQGNKRRPVEPIRPAVGTVTLWSRGWRVPAVDGWPVGTNPSQPDRASVRVVADVVLVDPSAERQGAEPDTHDEQPPGAHRDAEHAQAEGGAAPQRPPAVRR